MTTSEEMHVFEFLRQSQWKINHTVCTVINFLRFDDALKTEYIADYILKGVRALSH